MNLVRTEGSSGSSRNCVLAGVETVFQHFCTRPFDLEYPWSFRVSRLVLEIYRLLEFHVAL